MFVRDSENVLEQPKWQPCDSFSSCDQPAYDTRIRECASAQYATGTWRVMHNDADLHVGGSRAALSGCHFPAKLVNSQG